MKLRYRLHYRGLPGRPDIVFPGRKKVILIHGCFWHRHEGCFRATTPTRNALLWAEKFRKTVERDRANADILREQGWESLVMWECQIRPGGGDWEARLSTFLGKTVGAAVTSAERNQAYRGVSLFSGAGIGDIGYRAAGIEFVAMCEREADRAALARLNFPHAAVFCADVQAASGRIVEKVATELGGGGEELFLVSCTAPCQGMSKNGQGTLLRKIREGARPALDPRNRLILPALELIQRLRPTWVVLENVLEMRNTVIADESDKVRPILDLVFQRLGGEYKGQAYDVEFADYGIPQRRQRLITVLTRSSEALAKFAEGVPFLPPATHARTPVPSRQPWVSVSEAIADFPALDGGAAETATRPALPFHRVPVLDPKKYEWIRHTPPGRSAFDNQCVAPGCGFTGNRTHGASHDDSGVNRAHKDTPLYCTRCGALLPRPYTEDGAAPGGKRIMSGYTSAYKRMDPDLPAPALTRNLSYPCSDQKLHPTQHRVLSLAEAMRLHTLDRYEYRWGPLEYRQGRRIKRSESAPDSLIRLVIGESVPPLFFELLARHLIRCSDPEITVEQLRGGRRGSRQLTLW